MRLKILVLSTAAVSACSGGSGAAGPPPAPAGGGDYQSATVRAAARILPDRIREHIAFLASDELAGRDTPSPGLETAASYLVDALQNAGLEPAGEDGTFIQRFPYTRTAMVTASREVNYQLAGSTRELEYAQDYYVIPGQLSAANAGVVFGGPAGRPSAGVAQIAAGNVVFFTTEGNPVIGTGEDLITAFQAAAQGRAAAVVLILDDTQEPDSITDMASGLQGAGLATPLPIVGLSSASSAALLAGGRTRSGSAQGVRHRKTQISLDGITMNVAAPFRGVRTHTSQRGGYGAGQRSGVAERVHCVHGALRPCWCRNP